MAKKKQIFKCLLWGKLYPLENNSSFNSCCGARFVAYGSVYGSCYGIEMFPSDVKFVGTLKDSESHYQVPTRNGTIQFVVRDKK